MSGIVGAGDAARNTQVKPRPLCRRAGPGTEWEAEADKVRSV